MEDKYTNLLLSIILIIVLGLAGFFVYKVIVTKTSVNENSEEIISEATSLNNEKKNNEESIKQLESQISSDVKIPLVDTGSSGENQIKATDQINYKFSNNRYYYNQLDDYAKVIYDAVVDNIEKLVQGNYKIAIDYDFSPILGKNADKTLLDKYYNDSMNALNLDIANLFYIDFSKLSLNIESTTTILGTKYELYINSGNAENYYSDGYNSQIEVENAMKKVEKIKNDVAHNAIGSDYNKIVIVHDWLIEYLKYDSSSVNRANVYGALVEEKAVCEGYARTLKYILDELGIYNVLIVGTATNADGQTEEHMWNYVKYEDNWYAIDATWDDPIINGNGILSYASKHQYFMIGSKVLFESHVEKKNISNSGKIFTLPTLSSSNYQ